MAYIPYYGSPQVSGETVSDLPTLGTIPINIKGVLTNSTPKTVYRFVPPGDGTYNFLLMGAARDRATGDTSAGLFFSLLKVVGGILSIPVQNGIAGYQDPGLPIASQVIVNGNAVEYQITGLPGKTIDVSGSGSVTSLIVS